MQSIGWSAEELKAIFHEPLREHKPGNLVWQFCREHFRRLPF
jgi:hypothetical protein